MWLDVVDLRDFYDSPLGQVARRLLRRRIRQIWPNVQAQRVLGVGFATPYLRLFRDQAERVVAVMPASQGVLPWPSDGAGLVALAEDDTLPFPDCSFDRIVLVHSLENTESARLMMRDVWRVLTDSGRVLVITPNRQGLWARLERSPFASGQPYSAHQLSAVLRDTMFTPLATYRALFYPPTSSRMLRSWAVAIEELGNRWFSSFSGVVLVEAAKQIYAAPMPTKKVRQGHYLPIPGRLRGYGQGGPHGFRGERNGTEPKRNVGPEGPTKRRKKHLA
jgi:SAM-dependent methyltransferase